MKKLLLLTIAVSFIMISCNKTETPTTTPSKQDVVFSSSEMPIDNLKSSRDVDESLPVHYASIKINSTIYTPEVFYLENVAYTQVIKLDPGDYTLEWFMLMNNGSDNIKGTADDEIVKATPMTGSEFAPYVNLTLSYDFTVADFLKTEVAIEVLTFEAASYDSFGFVWFTPVDVTVREQVFFGDICVKHPASYEGSLYDNQVNGLQLDMPAIFKIDVYHNDVFVAEYNNELDADGNGWYGDGAPLIVRYVDDNAETDNFEFKLSILVEYGDGFDYRYFSSWSFTDDNIIPNGDDGVVDFALGNCHAASADLVLAPYINLPPVISNYYLTLPNNNEPTYVLAHLTSAGSGWEIPNGTYYAFCGEVDVDIYLNTAYVMDVYSSLYPELIPDIYPTENYPLINYMVNHLDDYPDYTWQDIQMVIWKLLNNWDGINVSGVGSWDTHPIAQQMLADANQFGEGFVPLPGGWAAVLFLNEDTPVQLQLIMVDP